MSEEPTFHPSAADAYGPPEIAKRVLEVGLKKAELDFMSLFALAVLAGAFIALGAVFATTAMTDSGLGFGPTRVLGGVVFSLGLILVIVAGAELFTGNNLIVMAWASRQVSTGQLLRNWGIVYLGNLIGALGTALLVYISGQYELGGGAVGETAVRIANGKVQLAPLNAIALGILCNALVCLAVWLCFGARTTTDKILAIIFPIGAFVAAGFEHSVANMYFIPLGILLKSDPNVIQASSINTADLSQLDWMGFVGNIIPVTVGNIIGGGLLVAVVYWFIYLRRGI